jgi:hypothetical protein
MSRHNQQERRQRMILDISVGSVEDVVQSIRDIAAQVGKSSNRRHKAAATQLRERADQLIEALRLEEKRNTRGKWHLAAKAVAKVNAKPEPDATPVAVAVE